MTFIFISTFALLLVLPTNFVCAFVVSVNHVNQGTPSSVSPMQQRFSITTASTTATVNTGTTGSSYLQAVALPAEQEDEKQKKKKNDNEEDEWTATKGGFIPNILKRRKQQQKQKQQKQQTQTHPSIHMVDNIHDYKNVVVDETEQIVVVRFFASWCRSCKATKPLFNKLVRTYSQTSEYGGVNGVNGVNVKFVEVPLTKETAYLQEGLGVPSVPFAHIYHPEGGLVEEVKISKPHFKDFHQKLTSYVVGSCDLPMEMDTASASASENESQIEEEGMNMNTNMNMEDGTIGAFE
jgi:thiol-disulfide isomerase/thioredoxin